MFGLMAPHIALYHLLIGREEVSAECNFFEVSSCEKERDMVEMEKLSKSPNLQKVKKEMKSLDTYIRKYFLKSSNFSASCLRCQLERLPLSVPSVI